MNRVICEICIVCVMFIRLRIETAGWVMDGCWMGDVDGALNGKYSNTKIHYFDPPTEHCAQYNLKSHDKTTGVLDSKEVVQY